MNKAKLNDMLILASEMASRGGTRSTEYLEVVKLVKKHTNKDEII